MKATIEIADPLFDQVRRLAAREGTTLRAIVEQSLRHFVEDKARTKPFKLRDGSVKGKGLVPELADAGFQTILDHSYGDRGGDRS